MRKLSTLLCILVFCLAAAAQPGTRDAAFNASIYAGYGTGMESGEVYKTVVQPDGKTLIAGNIESYDGQASRGIARLNANGRIDATFNPSFPDPSYLYALAVQADGKILVGGSFSDYGGTGRNNLVRLNSNGSTDAGFASGTGPDGIVQWIVALPGGKIVAGGNFSNYNGTPVGKIIRLNADGTLDPSFDASATTPGRPYAMDVQSDGKVVFSYEVSGGGADRVHTGRTAASAFPPRIARLNADGSLDTGFDPGSGPGNTIYTLRIQPDGKILIGGEFRSINGTGRNRIARLNSDGSVDTGFDPGTGASSTVFAIALQANGQILVGGGFFSINDEDRGNIARLNADGSLDATYGDGALRGTVQSIYVQPNGQYVAGGRFRNFFGSGQHHIARGNANGTADLTFTPVPGVGNMSVDALYLQSDGKILMSGSFNSYNGVSSPYFARVLSDGAIDATFNTGGTGASAPPYAIAQQPDGKILLGGGFDRYNDIPTPLLARLNANGSLDGSFVPALEPQYTVYSIALQPDGKILVAAGFDFGGENRYGIVRFNSNGSVDPGFNRGTGVEAGEINKIILQPDGKILVAGSFTNYNGTGKNYFMRLNADGSTDATFNMGAGVFGGDVTSMALKADGSIVISGFFYKYDGQPRNGIAAVNTNGGVLSSFTGQGVSGYIKSISFQADGKALIGGDFYSYNGTALNNFARLNADGTLDATFLNTGIQNGIVSATAVQSDGNILVGGQFADYAGTTVNSITRVNAVTVAAPVITTGTISVSSFCPGATVSVPFTVTGTFFSGNVFTAQLSNASGSFASPVTIGSVSATASGSISATIPSNTASGFQYRIRVVASAPSVTGTDNGTNLNIPASYRPEVTIAGPVGSICSSGSAALTSNSTFTMLRVEAIQNSYQWYKNDAPIPGATGQSYTVTAPVNGDQYKLTLTPGPGGPCWLPATAVSNILTLNVSAAPSATISYAGSPYPVGSGTASVTFAGTSGGAYSSTSGLSVDGSTGAINLAASTAGTYTVNYTVTTGCGTANASAQVTLYNPFAATISYPGSPFCASSGTASVFFSGTNGGSFSSTAGLSINATTGAIDLAASTPGTYSVRYGISPTDFVVTQVTIRPASLLTAQGNRTLCSGTPIAATDLGSVPGITYSWTNSNTGIGLAASGMGNLPAFTAQNAGSTELTATIGVVAQGGTACASRSTSFLVRVQPAATMNAVSNLNVCAGATVTQPFSSSATGTTFQWTSTNPATGIAADGTGSLVFTAQNNTASPSVSSSVTVRPVQGGCPGTPVSFDVTVNRSVGSLSYTGSPFCPTGSARPTLTGSNGGTFSSTGGLVIDGSTGAINLEVSAAGTYTVSYNASGTGGCGTSAQATVTVRPAAATVGGLGNRSFCTSSITPSIAFGAAPSYNWYNDNTAIGLAASGTGTALPSFIASSTARSAYITVVPVAGAGQCAGKPASFRIAIVACATRTGNANGNGNAGVITETGRQITDGSTASDAVLAPNPARETTTITVSEAGNYSVQVISLSGAPVSKAQSMSGNRVTIGTAGLPAGMYVIQLVNTKTGRSIRKQLVKL